MGYFGRLKKLAKESFDSFMRYIDEHKNLYSYNKKTDEGDTEIEVVDVDENFNEELIGRFYFNEDEDFLGNDEEYLKHIESK